MTINPINVYTSNLPPKHPKRHIKPDKIPKAICWMCTEPLIGHKVANKKHIQFCSQDCRDLYAKTFHEKCLNVIRDTNKANK